MCLDKIIILENQNLTKHLVDRLDFKNNYNGFYFECWNLLPLINYKLFKKYKTNKIYSKNKFINILSYRHLFKQLFKIKKKNFFYLNNCGLNLISTLIDIVLYFKGGKKVLLRPTEHKLNIEYNNRIKSIFRKSSFYLFKRIIVFFLIKFFMYFIILIKPNALIIFAGNNFIFKKYKKLKKKVYKFSCPEFEYFANLKLKISNDYIVYIDQDMFASYDNEVNYGPEQILDPLNYEKNLFKKIDQFIKLKIFKNKKFVVAAHPRRLKKLSFDKKKIIFNKTLELISQAKVVIAHTSLAIKYAVLLYKPIILLNAKNYFNSENLAEINFLKKELKLKTFDISENDSFKINNLKKILIDKKKYKIFISRYIHFPSILRHKKRWEQITYILKKVKIDENNS